MGEALESIINILYNHNQTDLYVLLLVFRVEAYFFSYYSSFCLTLQR